jgi:alpha-1,6-mannosyltransferase
MVLVVPGRQDGVHSPNAWVSIHTLRAPRAPVFDRQYRVVLPHRFLTPWCARIRRLLRDEEPQIVEVNDKYSFCYLAGALRRRWWPDVPRPTLIGHSAERMDDGLNARVQGGWPLAFARWYVSRVYAPLFDYHLANSRYTAEEIAQALPDWRHDHLEWLPMGVDTARFVPNARDEACRASLLARLNAPPTAILLAAAARLSPEKHPELLMPLMAGLNQAAGDDYRLVVAGDGPLRAWLEREARATASGRVLFLGHVGNELARVVASADVFVHVNPREPFGIAPLEAMACGTPVVLPQSGGLLDYATPDNAWMAAPTAPALSSAVVAAWSSPGERERRRFQAIETARGLSWPVVAARWFRQYDHLHERGVDEWHGRAARRSSVRRWSRAGSAGRAIEPCPGGERS